MEIVHERCAGLDVSKDDVKVCVRVQGAKGRAKNTITTWGATTNQILVLRDHLVTEGVTAVIMESTGDYWKPFYYVFEDLLNVMVVNARATKHVPGRKSDVSDAAWLADLGAHGLVRASFVPPPNIRGLRDLTRVRTRIQRERTREIQRLDRVLQDAGIKLSSVASDITGVSGRLMLQALIDGEPGPAAMADLAKGAMRRKTEALTEALTGRFTGHHGYLAGLHLKRIDQNTADITDLEARIAELMAPFQVRIEQLTSIPSIRATIAHVIIAETGADMSVFSTPAQLCSWAGVTPGMNQSAGRSKPAATRAGNRYLKAALGAAVLNIAKTKNTFLYAKYKRIAARRGRSRAIVAIEHTILTAIWHMFNDGTFYQDPGVDYYTRRNPDRTAHRAIRTLQSLGYHVDIQPPEPAVVT